MLTSKATAILFAACDCGCGCLRCCGSYLVARPLRATNALTMITLKTIAAISPEFDQMGRGQRSGHGLWGSSPERRRCGLRRQISNGDGRQRWATIGRHGAPWTPEMARDEARRILGECANGGDPARAKREARQAATVAELCDALL